MKFNSSIFNDAVNINQKLAQLDADRQSDYAVSKSTDFDDVRRAVGAQEVDPDDLAENVKKYEDDGESKTDATNDALNDLIPDVWADGSVQLWFVPTDTMLGCALKAYYQHLDAVREPKTHRVSFRADVGRYPRSGVNVQESDRDNPMHRDGFYFATGVGYSVTDELFAGATEGLKSGGVGSGMPARKFIDYLNSDRK